MKQVFCALLMLGLGSTAFAAKPYYVCSLKNDGPYVEADAEILVQFQDGKIAIKGSEATGTCFGEVRYMGTDGHYSAKFEYGEANSSCKQFNNIQWYSTNQGYADLGTNASVELDNLLASGVWASYSCK